MHAVHPNVWKCFSFSFFKAFIKRDFLIFFLWPVVLLNCWLIDWILEPPTEAESNRDWKNNYLGLNWFIKNSNNNSQQKKKAIIIHRKCILHIRDSTFAKFFNASSTNFCKRTQCAKVSHIWHVLNVDCRDTSQWKQKIYSDEVVDFKKSLFFKIFSAASFTSGFASAG